MFAILQRAMVILGFPKVTEIHLFNQYKLEFMTLSIVPFSDACDVRVWKPMHSFDDTRGFIQF